MPLGDYIFNTRYPKWATVINWYRAGLPKMALKGRLTFTTLNRTLSVRKFSGILNVTRRGTQSRGITKTGPTLENGRDGWSFDIGISSFLKAAKLIRFSAAPPSIKDVVKFDVDDGQGDEQQEMSRPCHALGVVRGVEADQCLHSLVVWRYLWGRCGGRHLSAQILDDATGCDVSRTFEHDVERLAALVVTRLRVRMAIYDLEVSFGLPEPQSFLLVLLGVFLLFVLPLAGRRTVVALLLQFLVVLF
jgi:hypothetical protein